MSRAFRVTQNQYGHVITQSALFYEVRITSRGPEDKWRKNHVVFAVAPSVEAAIQLAKELHPDDPVIIQVVLRNNEIDLVIHGDMLEAAQ